MRRMITTKQTNYIDDLSKVAEKGSKIGTYPASIDSVGILNVEETVNYWVENEEVDFEGREVASTAPCFFYYPELLEHYGLGDDGSVGYLAVTLGMDFTFPSTVTDEASFITYLKSPTGAASLAYLLDEEAEVDEARISNDVATYHSTPQGYSFDGTNIIVADVLECAQGEGEEIVGASDPISVDTLDVENLRVENLEQSNPPVIVVPKGGTEPEGTFVGQLEVYFDEEGHLTGLWAWDGEEWRTLIEV